MTRLLFLAALVALSTSTCMHNTAASPSALECRVEPRPPLTAGGPSEIRFVLTNPSREPVWFLRWNTPFEGWMGSILTVTAPDGTELPYTGPMVKRGTRAAESTSRSRPAARSTRWSISRTSMSCARLAGTACRSPAGSWI